MDYLTANQVKQLMECCKINRHDFRDATAILIAFRHGLRSTELCRLQWSDIDLDGARIFIQRVKGSDSGWHPLKGDEVRRLRQLKRESKSHYVFISQKGSPLTTRGFRYIVEKAGGKLNLAIGTHVLRHSCGYHLG